MVPTTGLSPLPLIPDMAYQHIYVIPDQGSMTGGDFYDRYGNLEYFADVAGLTDKTQTGADKLINVKAHTRGSFMRDPAPSSVSASIASVSVGIRQSKGIPGKTVTLMSDVGLPGQEKAQFQWTGSMSALVAWLKTTAKFQVHLVGPTGTPYDPIPGATP